jgi:hypothetical protein
LLAPTGAAENLWWAVAFLAGVVPITVLQRLGLLVSSTLGNLPGWTGFLKTGFATAFATPRALTQIDGIDMYESVRLESEGITDIPTLATTDLVSMMVDTRLPVERLVDWSDQAMLMMLLPEPEERPDDSEAGPSRVKALQQVGIRTASSLLTVASTEGDSRRTKAAEVVGGEEILEGLAQQISKEPSTRRIRHWRETELTDLCVKRPIIKVSKKTSITVRSGRTFANDVAATAFARRTAAGADDRLVIIDLRDDL